MSIKKLILASSSPYRRELLSRLQIPFTVISPEIDESPNENELPQALVERLAIEKAKTIASGNHNALVIGSDQVAVHDGNIIGKPKDYEHACQQLRQASGKTITLYTGLALVDADSGKTDSEVVPYRVTFRHLSDDQISSYLQKEQPYSCAGSVKSEGLGIALLTRFDGDDPNTLIGLPLIRLIDMLARQGFKIL